MSMSSRVLSVVLVVGVVCGSVFGQYCSVSGGGEQYISGVVVGNLVNMGTGSDGYADYTSMSRDIAVGESQVASITGGLYEQAWTPGETWC